MGNGVAGHNDLQQTQHDAQNYPADICAFLFALNGADNGQNTVEEEPARRHIEQNVIVHFGSAGYEQADEAQDQAENRKEEPLVIALCADAANDADEAHNKKQRDDEMACADKGFERCGHQEEAPDDHQNAQDYN